ncbi:MAG: hypothetical protein ACR2K2_02560 [Mycobacteriales bacterium]
MRTARVGLGVVGAAALAYGLWSMRGFDLSQLRSTVTWLVVGVVVHDAVLAPVSVALGLVAVRWLPAAARRSVAVGFVVWGTLTVLAFVVLTGITDTPDNASLLDRPYRLSWVVATVVLAAAVGVAAVVAQRRGVSHASNRRSD